MVYTITMLITFFAGIVLIGHSVLYIIDGLYWRNLDLLIEPSILRGFHVKRLVKWSSLLLIFIAISACGALSWGKLSVQLFLTIFLWMVTVTDFEQQLIFDEVLVAFGVVVLLAAPWNAVPFFNMLLGAALGGGIMFLVALLTRGAIGDGDLKLLIVLGLWQGVDGIIVTSFMGFLLGGSAAFFLLIFRFKKRRDTFAYGPYFVFGALLSFLL